MGHRETHRKAQSAYRKRQRMAARLAKGKHPELEVDESLFLDEAEFRATSNLTYADFAAPRVPYKVPFKGGY